MRQQINLYQPIAREAPRIFGAQTALRALAAVLVALALLWGYTTYELMRLEQITQALRDQQKQQEDLLSRAGTMSASRTTPAALAARVKRVENEVAARTRALELLRTGAVGRTTGFSARLEALARRHVEGVWIDHMVLSGGSAAMSLGGATLNPDLVPRYLHNLSEEQALAGARFDQLAIERPKEKAVSQVRFSASSLSLPALASTGDAGGAT